MDDEMELEGLLEEAIRDTVEKYNNSEAGSKESATLCECITKLCHAKLEFERTQAEFDDKSMKILAEKQKSEEENKRQDEKSKRERKEFLIGLAFKGGVTAATIAFALWQNTVGMLYEKDGYIKSATVRDIIRQTKPKFKMDV